MSEYLEPINPLEHITKRDPISEKVMDSTKWFKTETVELDFGEYVGRPDENVTMHTSMLAYYFANGWYVDAIVSRKSGGQWTSVAVSEAVTASDSASSSAGSTIGMSNASVNPGEYVSSSNGNSNANSSTSGTGTESGTSTTTTGQDGGPYWYTATRIRLKRRKLQSELVLQDMISSFTKAYNEGREINNSRYDELVALYSIILSRTENEAGRLADYGIGDYKPLADMVISECRKALEEYRSQAGSIPEDWMQSRIEEINRKFDALLSNAKTKAIDNGTYNTTVWPSTQSGIERDRQRAINDLSDTMVTTKIDAYGKIAAMTGDIGQKLLDCETRIIDAMQKSLIGPTEIRNTVFKWMADFMERREDDYPGLENLATIADRLGYGEGASSGPGSNS